MLAIDAKDVTKRYRNGVKALNGINLQVKEGEIFTLLGQNGAGKSTLIRILTTLMKPTSGHISILGHDIVHAKQIRSKIACVEQQISLDTYLSLEENMMFQSRLYCMDKKEAALRMRQLMNAFGLQPYRTYPVSTFSGGVKRRLDIAMHMMSKPDILFLDEPTLGMDVTSRIAMWKMLKKIRSEYGITIFLTTHDLNEAEQLSERICIMNDGKEVIQGSILELKTFLHQDMIKITMNEIENMKLYLHDLSCLYPDRHIQIQKKAFLITIDDQHNALLTAAQALTTTTLPIIGIEITQPTIEDIFIQVTKQQMEETVCVS